MANIMIDTIRRNARRLSPAFVPAAAAIGAATLALSAWWLTADALRGKPAIAAEVGMIRGELWLRDGWSQLQTSPEAAEAAFTRALRLSPMDAGAWFRGMRPWKRFGARSFEMRSSATRLKTDGTSRPPRARSI